MTDQRLRELLEERVADLTPIDLVDGAWERAAVVRRRRHAVAGAAVAVVVVVGTTTVVVSGRGDEAPPPPTTSSTESPAPGPKAERGGPYGGAEVWWAPATDQETDLPRLTGSGLPERIDLSETEGEVPTGVRAVGLFQLWGDEPGDVVVVGADGASYSLDVSRLEPVTDGGGFRPPVTQESLSPDGRHAFFVQRNWLEVYDFETAGWSRVPASEGLGATAKWTSDGRTIRILSASLPDGTEVEWMLYDPVGNAIRSTSRPDSYGGPQEVDDFHGPIKRDTEGGARGLFLAGPVPDPDGGKGYTLDAVGAGGRTTPEAILAMPLEMVDGRWKQCCPVVGWLDPETVLFESRHEDARILAWRVGRPDVYRVSDIRGWTPGKESYVASFADPSLPPATEPVDLPTAERGPAYGGASIWWAPPAGEETSLPWLGDSPLPQTIDLSEGLPPVPTGRRAVGVFQIRSRGVVLTHDGTTYSFAIDHLDPVADEEGNAIGSLGDVSPDGRHVFFVQRSSLEVYDFLQGTWSTIETPDWLAEGAAWFDDRRIWVPEALGATDGTAYSVDGDSEAAPYPRDGDIWGAPGAQAVLPAIDNGDASPYAEMVAQDYVVSEPMTGPDGTSTGGAHVLLVGQPDSDWAAGLAYPFVDGDRGLGSVAVLDWVTPTQVLYWSASASTGRRILAWDPGTRWLARVSELTGLTDRDPLASSFADLTPPGD
ncbi:hypothetical protein [Nocardioides bizhenqiangii]|uniref:WD40 repeat domain-containing protein n=1 Tax=Nocardioides bizhenqiangii TaxID=3095076 RepID=A0ABZ0ZT18_9ACTN|nr:MULTISPECIES: hypothetical protein [unclassified Nocardioides]MDZ5621903.1 hypothetical protein [Nocardioides sp. HM23]WQQ27414.1 hypothetical protein SHK19_04100 [Nocardioides sp. HM61]